MAMANTNSISFTDFSSLISCVTFLFMVFLRVVSQTLHLKIKTTGSLVFR